MKLSEDHGALEGKLMKAEARVKQVISGNSELRMKNHYLEDRVNTLEIDKSSLQRAVNDTKCVNETFKTQHLEEEKRAQSLEEEMLDLLDHTQTDEDGIILEDGEDLLNEPEEEEAPEKEAIDIGSDNEDPSDPFESHFARLSPFRLASISCASQGERKDTTLPKSRLPGNAYLSIPRGSEQTTGGRRIEGLKDLNLKKKLVAEERTPL